ncbi:beta-glucuronidase [Peptoniphilus sp. MSJ-1]|uniref:Beta-glucuronidase n=1 Tax=Peptoniphilus ovalis TaxID=2841503 RepID=A0ABS6FH47_9FIRM|nr:beta-glucuronidase [Peptoniphilus ovalis]MBU5668788.1 beta-glucuronidase [Peptoniphilus ovalis]
MLYPKQSKSRTLIDLSGIWSFQIENGNEKINPGKELPDKMQIAVPASFNDQLLSSDIRNFAGYFYYQRKFTIPKALENERIFLYFGSATHEAWVYLNGKEICHHKGGFTPFQVELENFKDENLLTVKMNNILDYSTLPVGNYSKYEDEEGNVVHKVDENFDFFNYAGLNRPVKIYTCPKSFIEDIVIVPEIDFEKTTAKINCKVEINGDYDFIEFTLIDEDGNEILKSKENNLEINNPKLWWPLNAYLYKLKVDLYKDKEIIDTYTEEFGIRKVEVRDGKFLINNEPFYFKGFGKHEDSYINGRGINEAINVLDINLIKDMGANSIRTSHYPYSEEMMRLCDREGIVVIDEVPAVGLLAGFDFNPQNLENFSENKTWEKLNTMENHKNVIRELIERDKNHACVVMWSLANEAANFSKGAKEYFSEIFKFAKSLDLQQRPCTYINIMMSLPETDLTTDLTDVICLNRYYGWYVDTGNLEKAAKDVYEELIKWQEKYPDKPIMYTEYGADTVAGFHSLFGEPFSEEFQEDYYKVYSNEFDKVENFIGEQVWNFADFQTKFGTARVQGNKKGIFTRSREPKKAAAFLKNRWRNIPDFNYKK